MPEARCNGLGDGDLAPDGVVGDRPRPAPSRAKDLDFMVTAWRRSCEVATFDFRIRRRHSAFETSAGWAKCSPTCG
jgi:hypothetical protein